MPRLRLATGPLGGAFHAYGAALATRVSSRPNLVLAPRLTWGGEENLHFLEPGHVQFACASLEATLAALAGSGSFALRPLRRVRAALPLYGMPSLMLVPPAADMADWRGLEGKRVGLYPAGGTAAALVHAAGQALGINLEPVIAEPAALAEAFAAGRLAALLAAGGQGRGWFGDLPARPLPLPAEDAAALAALVPGQAPALIPTAAGPVPGLAAWQMLLAQAGLAEDWTASVVTTALAEAAALRPFLPAEAVVSADPAAFTMLPWHPGAARALRAAGFSVPEAPGE